VERDELVERVFETAGLPLVRIPLRSAYNILELQAQIQSALPAKSPGRSVVPFAFVDSEATASPPGRMFARNAVSLWCFALHNAVRGWEDSSTAVPTIHGAVKSLTWTECKPPVAHSSFLKQVYNAWHSAREIELSMYTLRCTQKLLKRMHLTVADLKDIETPEPTTALGDWYAHLLMIQRQHLVMLVNERSRLCILTPAKDIDRLRPRFERALEDLLRSCAIPEASIQEELRHMGTMCYGLTTGTPHGRSVLGSMNDYTRPLEYTDLNARSHGDWNLSFSDRICGPLDYGRPINVARELLAAVATPVK